MQVIAQGYGVVIFAVTGTVEQDHVSSGCRVDQRLPDLRVRVELGRVTVAKLLPFVGVMAEPLTKFGARRDVFEPTFDGNVGAAYATRPESLNEKSLPTRPRVVAIETEEFDHSYYPQGLDTCPCPIRM